MPAAPPRIFSFPPPVPSIPPSRPIRYSIRPGGPSCRNHHRPDYRPPRPGYHPPRPGYHPPRPGYHPPRPGYHPPRPGPRPIRPVSPMGPRIPGESAVVERCEVCNGVLKGARRTLGCGHQSHEECLKQYVFAATEGKVLLTEREREKIALECLVCAARLDDATLRELFHDNIDYFINERQDRIRVEAGAVAPPREEVKAVRKAHIQSE